MGWGGEDVTYHDTPCSSTSSTISGERCMQGSTMTIAKRFNPDIKIQIHIFLSPYIFCRTNERIRKFALNLSSCVIMSPFFVTTCFRKYDQ